MTVELAPANLRVAILTPTGRDGPLTAQVLGEAGIAAVVCPDLACVESAVRDGVGALLIAEEAIAAGGQDELVGLLASQPPWSDLPVLLLARPGVDSPTVRAALQTLGNVTLVERPVRVASLLSAVRAALKARQRQYQLQAHLQEREQTAEVLRQADRRKDEFLATLAHELRNPLAPIRNGVEILRLSASGDPVVAEVCTVLERQVGNLIRLVDDLLEVSRITRGKIELRIEPVELAAVIRGAVETSRPLIEAGGHQLAISMPTESLVVRGDPVRLSQVFANLLNNAAKYMDHGGQIWLTVRRDAEHVLVAVRDTGVGIPAESLPTIFDLFTQVERSTRLAQGGLGIGLSLVRSLTELHGGTVTASSAGPGQGSEFAIRLPLSRVAVAEQPPRQSPLVLAPRRVLVVDDNRDAAVSMGRLLELLGAKVQVAGGGPEALELLASFRPAVILLDLGMPGMDGFEVARRIRTQADLKDVVLIALTGWGQESDRRRTQAAGFDHHLTKPANLDALQSLLACDAAS